RRRTADRARLPAAPAPGTQARRMRSAVARARPRGGALAPQLLEILPVLERVHVAPESVERKREQLALGHQPIERLEHEVLAVAHVVEDVLLEREEAAVDPDHR